MMSGLDLPRLQRVGPARLPTDEGEFALYGFAVEGKESPYLALVMGDIRHRHSVLARVHSCCATGDSFGSLKCDCRAQFDLAKTMIAAAGSGVIVYATDHEGRGIGILGKIRAYAEQDKGADTYAANRLIGCDADTRDYGIAVAVLRDLGVAQVDLMTNNPAKVAALERYGVTVSRQVPLVTTANFHNRRYLDTKRLAGHRLDAPLAVAE